MFKDCTTFRTFSQKHKTQVELQKDKIIELGYNPAVVVYMFNSDSSDLACVAWKV